MTVDSRITDLEKKVKNLERDLAALQAAYDQAVTVADARYKTIKQNFAGLGKGL